MICPHCVEFMNEAEDLREQLRAYRDEDKARLDDARVHKLAKTLKLSEQPAAICLALYDTPLTLSRGWLSDNRIARKKQDLTQDKNVDVLICRIRKRLPPHSIDNVWGRGFQMTDKGRLAVKEALL